MKNIQNYQTPKYLSDDYTEISSGVYLKGTEYVTSLSFIQEPEYGEGDNATDISQYPLEDILDKFYVYVSDFYREQNTSSSKECFLEFASPDMKDVVELRSIIGKHVYNQDKTINGQEYSVLEIE